MPVRRSPVRMVAEQVYERLPATRRAIHLVNDLVNPPWFSGWGMTTHHAAPWEDRHDWAHFRQALQHVQEDFEHGLYEDTGITGATVDVLRWRHWMVSCSVRYASRFAEEELTLVECGVGDGLTAYFAGVEAEHEGAKWTLPCYDAWAEVKVDGGTKDYSATSLQRTQHNLRRFGDRVRYRQGYLPETLDGSAPQKVDYLSIDLNAAQPTIDVLDFFLPRLTSRAVVLFDDYGHIGYEATKEAVDAYVAGRPGVLMKSPTGQALWYV